MKNQVASILSIALIIVLFLIALLVIYELPPDAQIVTQWAGNGQPNGWMNKWPGLFLVPVLATFLHILISILPQRNSQLSGKIQLKPADKKSVITGMLFIMVATELFIAIKAVGYI